ncbi:SF1B family DNA helicase RecD2 [Alkalicoccus chagannorensis]|uniref:SF1B family DNA helicase RecD2 n=1 Tax=Alkalicoccus chagannorensis TaxID=427072 RepID=UPI000418E7F5|nr:ATP-dependent RecD-like DNA helicase [Alkalicoccus chagannorensis]
MVEETTPYIKGELLHLIYHQEDSLYTVAKIKKQAASFEWKEKEMVVVGLMAKPEQDITYIFYGSLQEHPRFGKQFRFDTYEKKKPDTKHGLELYFSSDRFPGIGRKTAEKIVDHFGLDAISAILARPSRLTEIPKLDSEKADAVHKQLLEDQGIEEVLTRLYAYGFGLHLAIKIYQTYKTEAVEIIEKNPYQMVEDVEGIGFAKADQIGHHQGIRGSHPDRIRAALQYTLHEHCLSDGHVYADREEIIQRAVDLLEKDSEERIDPEKAAAIVVELDEEGKIITEDNRMYIPSLYYAEQGIASNVRRIMDQRNMEFPESELLKAIGQVEDKHDITYAPSQQQAVMEAVTSPVMMLTGGPGTGKTTVIQGVIEVYAELHGLSIRKDDYEGKTFPFLLAAPTGRAAKRMKESTGMPAGTIHRLLGYKGLESEGFEKDEDTPLDGSLLIIDEMSMVDTWLANQLFRAVPNGMQVLIVGDEDQLPSVGPGQVLADLLASSCVPVVKLTDIYRQSYDSQIITFSHDIKEGRLPEKIDHSSSDLRFFSCGPDAAAEMITAICRRAVEKGYTAREIQVLAPMYRGPAGITALNLQLQELFNPKRPGTKEVSFGDVSYRVGDMVLQLVNNLEDNVFNGDRGEIVAILTEKETAEKQLQLVIAFDGTEVTYTRQDLTQITHAYCCSIHKSQGSEFPMVIMPVVRSYSRMLRRKLIYTGITRAQQFLLLCGEWSSLSYAVQTDGEEERNTTLVHRLQPEEEHVDNG